MSIEKEPIQMTEEYPSIKRRLLLFLATYTAGVVIFEGITMIQFRNFPNSTNDLLSFPIQLLVSAMVLPGGLFQAFAVFLYRALGIYYVDLIVTDIEHGSFLSVVFAGISYLIFLGIARAALLTKSRRALQVLYYVFVGLLVFTIGGCTIGLR